MTKRRTVFRHFFCSIFDFLLHSDFELRHSRTIQILFRPQIDVDCEAPVDHLATATVDTLWTALGDLGAVLARTTYPRDSPYRTDSDPCREAPPLECARPRQASCSSQYESTPTDSIWASDQHLGFGQRGYPHLGAG